LQELLFVLPILPDPRNCFNRGLITHVDLIWLPLCEGEVCIVNIGQETTSLWVLIKIDPLLSRVMFLNDLVVEHLPLNILPLDLAEPLDETELVGISWHRCLRLLLVQIESLATLVRLVLLNNGGFGFLGAGLDHS
jgi:hypothetical protein